MWLTLIFLFIFLIGTSNRNVNYVRRNLHYLIRITNNKTSLHLFNTMENHGVCYLKPFSRVDKSRRL